MLVNGKANFDNVMQQADLLMVDQNTSNPGSDLSVWLLAVMKYWMDNQNIQNERKE